MVIEWEISVNDILTTLTISISALALIISWSKDRYLLKKQQADRVRKAVSNTLVKLDRLENLKLSLFQKVQPIFVETSEKLVDNFDVSEARDFLWKKINSEISQIQSIILEEKIEIAYIDLFTHFPEVRDIFLRTIDNITIIEEEILEAFLEETQDNVMILEKQKTIYTSAMLGNSLRKTSVRYKYNFKSSLETSMQPIREFLFEVISMTDQDILNRGISRNKLRVYTSPKKII